MTAHEILVVGSVNQDLVVRSKSLPIPGETVLGGQFSQVPGGKGANQAVACKRAGTTPVSLVAAVGTDTFGQQSLAQLQAEQLGTENLHQLPGCATGIALILVDAQGENCISVAPGANEQLQAQHLPGPDCSTWHPENYLLASLEVPWDTIASALSQAKKAGMTTVLNPAPASAALRSQAFLQDVDILTPNAREASLLTGTNVTDVASAEQAAQRLQQLGCPTVLVTLGAAGLVLREKNQSLHIAGLAVDPVDSTAAGDCLNGALVAALAAGNSLLTAAEWANAAAALSVTRPGAQPSLPRAEEIEARWQAQVSKAPDR